MSSEKKVRIGIIGTGGIARTHVRHYKAHPFVEIAAVADIVPGRAAAFVQSEGIPNAQVYESHKELLEKAQVEGISVCTYNMGHREPAVDSLNAGKHVLLEKPMAATLEDAKAIMRAWEAAKDRILMVGFQPDFGLQHKVAKQVIDSGALGQIYYAESISFRRWGTPGGNFINKETAGAGTLVDTGVYALHSTLTLMGNPKPVAVSATTNNLVAKNVKGVVKWGRFAWRAEDFEVEDFATAFIRLETGAVIVFKSCWSANADGVGRPFFLGTKGGLRMNERGANPPIELYFNQAIGDLNLTAAPQGLVQYEDWPLKIQAFAEAVRDNLPSPIDPRGVFLTNVIMDGVLRSSELGCEVKVDCSW